MEKKLCRVSEKPCTTPAHPAQPAAAGSLREQMPATAGLVDWLRAELGQATADAIVRKGMAGRGGFWVREHCPDGQLREFGSKR